MITRKLPIKHDKKLIIIQRRFYSQLIVTAMDMTMLRAGMDTWLESKAPARPEEKLAVKKAQYPKLPGLKARYPKQLEAWKHRACSSSNSTCPGSYNRPSFIRQAPGWHSIFLQRWIRNVETEQTFLLFSSLSVSTFLTWNFFCLTWFDFEETRPGKSYDRWPIL